MLKFLLYAVAVLAAVVVLVFAYAAATQPDTFRVERSASIAAPPEKIYPLISNPKTFATWSPFEKDPAMKRVFSGPDEGKGARYDWNGNSEVGSGWFVVSDATAPSRVGIDLHMTSPMKADNQVLFTLAPEGSGTKVTWSMEGPVPLVAKVLHLCFDADKMVGGAFETGLASLKQRAESS